MEKKDDTLHMCDAVYRNSVFGQYERTAAFGENSRYC